MATVELAQTISLLNYIFGVSCLSVWVSVFGLFHARDNTPSHPTAYTGAVSEMTELDLIGLCRLP